MPDSYLSPTKSESHLDPDHTSKANDTVVTLRGSSNFSRPPIAHGEVRNKVILHSNAAIILFCMHGKLKSIGTTHEGVMRVFPV